MSAEQEQQSPDKVQKAFDETVIKLQAIVKSDNLFPKKKVKKDELVNLVNDLFKEENDQLVEGVKTELKTLLKGYVTMKNSITEEEKKLAKFKEEQMKKFNDAASKLFKSIDDIPTIQAEYAAALKQGAEAAK